LAAAAGTLKLFEQYAGAAFTTTKSIQLAVRQKDRERIKSGLERLCVMPAARGWALRTAIGAMNRAGMHADVFEILDKAVDRPDAVPEVGAYWMQGCIAFRQHDCARRLQGLTDRGDIGEQATETYVLSLLNNRHHFQLSHFIEQNGHWLAKNAATCSLVAFTLQQLGKKEEAMSWVRDLRQLQGFQPWMLLIALELYWDAGEMGDVVEVGQLALDLPVDNETSIHRIWLAAAAVFSGDAESAEGHLGFVNPMTLGAESYVLFQMTDAVIRISTAAKTERQQAFRGIRKQIEETMQEIDKLAVVKETHREFWRQSIKLIRRRSGGVQAWIWCYWTLFQLSEGPDWLGRVGQRVGLKKR
jgi:hypothetical protein